MMWLGKLAKKKIASMDKSALMSLDFVATRSEMASRTQSRLPMTNLNKSSLNTLKKRSE